MVLGAQFGETVYICEVDGSRKVKSDAWNLYRKFFLRGRWEDSAPNPNVSIGLELSETSRAIGSSYSSGRII